MPQQDLSKSRAMFGILESIDQDGGQSQRVMATRFGVALGLVNAYLKICVKKGYVKVRRLPSRRYAYLLTPKGAAEKLRLSVLLLSNELERFRHARTAYAELFGEARRREWRGVVLLGASELAEIAAICAMETDIAIVALVDGNRADERFIGLPLVTRLADVAGAFDGAFLTDVRDPQGVFAAAESALGAERVLAPAFFGFDLDVERAA